MLFSRHAFQNAYEALAETSEANDSVKSDRLEAYSDAVLAIIATILVVPLMKLDEQLEKEILISGESLQSVLLSEYRMRSLFLYYASFWLVSQVWIWHGRQFKLVEKVDTVLVLANWGELLGASLFPFTAGTASNAESVAKYNKKQASDLELPLYFNIVVLVCSHLFFQLVLWYRGQNTVYRVVEAALICCPCVLSLVLGMCGVELAFVPVLTLPAWQALAVRVMKNKLPQESADHDSFISGVTKSRLEFFTDGVVAISATLIVLDVQPGENCGDLDLEMCIVHWSEGCRVRLPDFKCYFDYAESKSKTTYMIFAYIACFMIVNLLWAQHHYLFDKIHKKITVATVILNGHFCFFVSLLPFSFRLVTDYAIKPFSEHEIPKTILSVTGPEIKRDVFAADTACTFLCVSLFGAGVSLLGLLLEETVPRVLLFRYLVTPCVSLLTLILLSSRVRVMFWPLILIPLIQVVWGLADSGTFSRCFNKRNEDNGRSRSRNRGLLTQRGASEDYITFPTRS